MPPDAALQPDFGPVEAGLQQCLGAVRRSQKTRHRAAVRRRRRDRRAGGPRRTAAAGDVVRLAGPLAGPDAEGEAAARAQHAGRLPQDQRRVRPWWMPKFATAASNAASSNGIAVAK